MNFQEMLNEVAPNPEAVDILFLHADNFYDVSMSMFSIGTLYVATVCQQAGFKVKCLGTQELFQLDKQALRQALQRWQPKIVGFYAVIDNIANVQRYAKWIKRWQPQAITVVGGPQASTIPYQLAENPDFDFIVPGEGEFVMRDLANHLLRHQGKLAEIASIVYRQDGEIKAHPRAAVIEDLDALPFPNHDLVNMIHGQHISTGRGCPYRCAFCFKEDYNNRFRCRSAANVAQEIIARQERYPVTNVYITDDVFAVDHRRVMEFCRLITDYKRRTKKEFVFFCEGRAEVIAKHPDMLEALVEAGMARLQIGIESGNAQMLKDYGKNLKPEHVVQTLEIAQRLQRLTVAGNFIIGGPHENDATVRESLDFAKQLLRLAPTIFECTSTALSALPGTRLTKCPEEYGITILDTEFLKGMTLSDAYCETEYLSQNEIRNWRSKFEQEISQTMLDIIRHVDYATIKRHVDWAQHWHLYTFYYLSLIAPSDLLRRYFDFLASPRFKRLEEIPHLELPDYIPMRTIVDRRYSHDGQRLLLPEYWGHRYSLVQKLEIMLYEYAAAKLSLGDIARRLEQELDLKMPIPKIIAQVMLPVYRKLEDRYQVVFYR